MAPQHHGRLELAWTDKDKALLSAADGRYDYTFVDPADHRASEVRLLHVVEHVEAPTPEGRPVELPEPTTGNLLITGDAMHVLDVLAKAPEYADTYLGKVKLAYIDPPFNTGQTFEHYEDSISHSVWLTMMRDRLRQLRPLLAPDGSVWVHLDDSEVHRMRLVLDEELGPENFVATVIWQKAYSPRNDAGKFSTDHDYILVYSRQPGWTTNRLERLASRDALYVSPDDDPQVWVSGDPAARDGASHQGMVYGIQSPFTGEFIYPAMGRHWGSNQASMKAMVEEWGVPYRLEELDDAERRAAICSVPTADIRRGVQALVVDMDVREAHTIARARHDQGSWPRLYFTRNGYGGLKLKRYLGEIADDRSPQTLWLNTEVGHNRTAKAEIRRLFPRVTPFATPKPELLIQKVLEIGTQPGDIVLDFFVGSGTTAAVAHKMGRRWVATELLADTVDRFAKPRLAKVIQGLDDGGITFTKQLEAVHELPQTLVAEDAKTFTRLLSKFAKALDDTADEEELSGDEDDVEGEDADADDDDDAEFTFADPAIELTVKRLKARARTRTVKTRMWHGGGGFTHLQVGPSMFTEYDGMVLLADWAVQGDLTQAMCAQLGVRYAPDGIFAGASGRTRYVVVDGLAGTPTVEAVLDRLPEGQIVEVWATQIDEGAADLLRTTRPGSRLEVIPTSVLDSYRRKAAHRSPFGGAVDIEPTAAEPVADAAEGEDEGLDG